MKRKPYTIHNFNNRRKPFTDDSIHEKMQQGIDNWVKGLRSIKETPEISGKDTASQSLISNQT